MTAVATLIWLLNVLCDTVGQLCFKAAATHGGDADGLERWLIMAANKWIWIGIAAYVGEIFSWIALLSVLPLSMAVLLGTLSIVCVMIGGKLFFKEKITVRRAVAVLLVAAGVFLVGSNS